MTEATVKYKNHSPVSVHVCPGTLADGFKTYSAGCLRYLYNGRKVSHVLQYDSPLLSELTAEEFMENRKRISISGVQEKLSMLLDKNVLRLTKNGEQGTYLLKPVPRDLKKTDQVPANEHLTMQIAKQVYGLHTAPNAMVFFSNGSPAYITKRFDVKEDHTKWGVEDFASVAGKTSHNAGANFKYDFSYEELGLLLKKYLPAWRVEIEKYFALVVFNYLFSNGDAHLKNFSVMENASGDYLLSPAYDLVNSRIHVDDSDFAFSKGLFADNYKSSQYKKNGHPSKADFTELSKRLDIAPKRAEKILLPYLSEQPNMLALLKNSFLNDSTKKTYRLLYNTKRNYLNAK